MRRRSGMMASDPIPAAVRASLARRANEAGRASRRGGAPTLTSTSNATQLARWLQWNDPNGAHTAELAKLNDFDPYTTDEAWEAVASMLADADA